MTKERVIGILGGMRPEATVDNFYQDHLKIIISNIAKIPDRASAILSNGASLSPNCLRVLALQNSRL